jgi:multicomponent Na+:H+ antiporter subunit D
MASNDAYLAALPKAMIVDPVPAAHWLTIMPPVWCIVFGAILLIARRNDRLQATIAIAALVGLVVIDGLLLAAVIEGGPMTMVMGRWLPPFGIAFTVDLTGALFALTTAIAALAGGIFALGDINITNRRYGFYPFLFLMIGGVSGAFLTGDIFNLYVWFEVLLISSFGLIVLGSEHEQLDGATKYAILNLIGKTLFLIAVGYLYANFGTLNMADLAVKASEAGDKAPLMTLALLFLMAFGMKAAAFPVNFWLPASYHTPRIVVSALFAGLLTKVGIYALLRTMLMLMGIQNESYSLLTAILAAATMLTGVFGALAQTDLRKMFGYLVISGIGSILAGIALASQGGVAGAIFYSLHSMIVMMALYLLTGIAGRLGGSFSLNSLSGLYRQNPLVAAIALALFFAVSGLPPFSGFWPKVMLVKASLDVGAWWLAAALLVTGFLTTITVGRVFALAWWRPALSARGTETVTLEWTALFPLIALTLIATIFGLFPESILSLSQWAAAGILDPAAYIHSVFPKGVPIP